MEKEKKKSEWKKYIYIKEKKEKRKREKKRVYINKRGVRKQGSESEPASSTHVKGCLVCTPSCCGITLQRKNILPPGSTQPSSRTLAKPCHNSHPLPALHIVVSSTRKEKECSPHDLGLCYSTPFGTCSYAKKGDVLCTSNPKALCQQIMQPRFMVSTH